MDPTAFNANIENQDWLDPVADAIQKPTSAAFNRTGAVGKAIEDFLHGKWLGHPLHATVTDVPIGAFSLAAIFDLVGSFDKSNTLNKAADAAVIAGILTGMGAAVAGVADYASLNEKKPKRVGAMHALLNTGVLVLYGGSFLARRSGRRGLGKALGWAGYALLNESAFLGGTLVYEQNIGVDHANRDVLPAHWTAVLPETDLLEGEMKGVVLDGANILVARYENVVYALGSKCSHLGGPLEEGQIHDGCVTCPWHGSTFALETGAIQKGPAVYPQPTLEVRVYEGQIQVRTLPVPLTLHKRKS